VDRTREASLVEDLGEIDQGARRARDRDAVDEGAVAGCER
jgi:hypothetical protein